MLIVSMSIVTVTPFDGETPDSELQTNWSHVLYNLSKHYQNV